MPGPGPQASAECRMRCLPGPGAQVRCFLEEFSEHLGNVSNLPTGAVFLPALTAWLETEGAVLSPYLLAPSVPLVEYGAEGESQVVAARCCWIALRDSALACQPRHSAPHDAERL